MFVSFEENELKNELKKAKETNDFSWIKAAAINTMWNDPTFVHGETDELMAVLKKELPQIFVKEKKLEYEEHLERPLWNKDYFTDLTYWFRENFAEERIPYIKEVGRAVYKKDVEQTTESNDQKKKMVKKAEEQKEKSKAGGAENFHKPGMVIAAIILVILLVLLLKNLFK